MSKQKFTPRTIKEAEKIAGFHCKEVEEMAMDVGARIMRDQTEWLDSVMRDILPPNLYEMGKREEGEEEISEYVAKHGIRIVFVPDHLVIRVMLREQVHAQFIPKLSIDGQPIEMKTKSSAPDQN